MIRVMLIDDHPVVRAGLRTILDGFPDITVVAEGADGTAALDATREDVDVVVCDIQMPGIGKGFDGRLLIGHPRQAASLPRQTAGRIPAPIQRTPGKPVPFVLAVPEIGLRADVG